MKKEEMKTEIIVRGAPQSVSEHFELCRRCFTFAVTVPNEAGLKHGRAHAPLRTCGNFLRSKATKGLFSNEKNLENKIVSVGGTPGEFFNENPKVDYNYARPQTFLIYDKESPETKEFDPETNPNGFRWVKKTLTIQTEDVKKVYTNTVPVTTFGGKEYVWYNKKECENNKSNLRKLIMHECYERSVPFNASTGSNDFGETTYFMEQYERLVTEGCTEEELEKIVPVKLSSEDGYEKAVPMYTEKQLSIIARQETKAFDLDRK